jgi:hypothetical protein
MTQKLKKHVLTTVVITLAAVTVTGSLFYVTNVFSQVEQKSADLIKSPEAAEPENKRGGIRTRSKSDPVWTQPVNTQTLIRQSDGIVVGAALSNRCLYSNDAFEVKTLYDFKINEVIKGNFRPDETIKVSLPGGLIHEGYGSMLQIATPGFRKMKNNVNYVIFLKKTNQQEFTSLRGPWGIFEIINNDFVIPYGHTLDNQGRIREQRFNAVEFLASLRNRREN